VFAEYTLVTGVVVLAAGLALYGLGVPLVQAYYLTKLSCVINVVSPPSSTSSFSG